MAAGAPSARIVGLDAWRAALMLGGLFVHGSMWLPDAPLFTVVASTSQAFRMGAFFAIAGFLSARALSTRPPQQWLRRRIVQLGMPLGFGITILSPLIWWLSRGLPPGSFARLISPFSWHHLWFLVALILYSAAASALFRVASRRALIGRLGEAIVAEKLSALSIFMLVAATSIVLMVATKALVPVSVAVPFPNIELIAAYFPVFLFGMSMDLVVPLRAALLARWRGHAGVLAAVALVSCLWFCAGAAIASPRVADAVAIALKTVALALGPATVFLIILRSAQTVQHIPRIVRDLSEASYTMYLLHVPIICLVNLTTLLRPWHTYTRYGLAIGIAFGTSYGFHRLVVRRSPILSFLLNGKTAPAAPPLSPLVG
jgi:glucan biosynthesis protein C